MIRRRYHQLATHSTGLSSYLSSLCLSVQCLVLTLPLITGCEDQPASEIMVSAGEIAGDDARDDVGVDARDDVGVDAGEDSPFDATSYEGVWDVKIRLVDVGNIEVDFLMTISASAAQLDNVTLAVKRRGAVSEVIATLSDVPVNADGTFEVAIGETAVPAEFSPTGSAVVVTFTLSARPNSAGFCGGVIGEVVSLSLPINASSFGATPEGSVVEVPGSCDDETEPVALPRIDLCPELNEGMNVISSAGYERTFEVILPTQYTPEERWPLVTLWHGFGSDLDTIKEISEMANFVDERGFILVVPTSYPGGAVEWDSLAPVDSPDLAFFDDLTRCLFESWSIDQDRLHVTGMSGGGLWTAYLTVFRSEVIASAVGMSSGLIPDYPAEVNPIPYLAAWGGVNDIAYDQDFHILAQDLIDEFKIGRFLMACNHRQEHNWLPEFTPWVIQFLLDHPRGPGGSPYAMGLPEGVYPGYCEVIDDF